MEERRKEEGTKPEQEKLVTMMEEVKTRLEKARQGTELKERS